MVDRTLGLGGDTKFPPLWTGPQPAQILHNCRLESLLHTLRLVGMNKIKKVMPRCAGSQSALCTSQLSIEPCYLARLVDDVCRLPISRRSYPDPQEMN